MNIKFKNQTLLSIKLDELERSFEDNVKAVEKRIAYLEEKMLFIEQTNTEQTRSYEDKLESIQSEIRKLISEIDENEKSIMEKLDKGFSVLNENLNQNREEISLFNKKIVQNQLDQKTACEKNDENTVHVINKLSDLKMSLNNLLEDIRNEQSNIEDKETESLIILSELKGLEKNATESISIVNRTLQEIVANVIALDEGNRIIISKMLLQEMEV